MIPFPKVCLLPALSIALAACGPGAYQAENLEAKPFNQLELAGNACGPAALLNSWRFGAPKWRKLSETPPELSDRDRIRSIARGPAMRESSSLPGRARWSRNGINLLDLRDVANEIGTKEALPPINHKTYFLEPRESQWSHLRRIHADLASSLGRGFPPILSIRRFVERNGSWIAVQGHFVTIVSVPVAPNSGQTSFEVRYIDPLGGKLLKGNIAITSDSFLGQSVEKAPNLEAIFPDFTAGKRSVRPGEKSYLAVSAGLGRFQ